MKKIISILFLSCFVICSPSRAQAQALVKAARTSGRALSMGTPVKLPKVLPIVSQQTVVKRTPITQMRNGNNSITHNSRVGTAVQPSPTNEAVPESKKSYSLCDSRPLPSLSHINARKRVRPPKSYSFDFQQ